MFIAGQPHHLGPFSPNNRNWDPLFLHAFNPEAVTSGIMQQLVMVQLGTWPNTSGNANLVPVVANGEVFVATNKQLEIFGIAPSPKN